MLPRLTSATAAPVLQQGVDDQVAGAILSATLQSRHGLAVVMSGDGKVNESIHRVSAQADAVHVVEQVLASSARCCERRTVFILRCPTRTEPHAPRIHR